MVSAAKGLIALGIAKGDAVTIFPPPVSNGAFSISHWPQWRGKRADLRHRLRPASPAHHERFGGQAGLCDNRERFDRLDSVKDHCPALKQILMIEGNALGALEGLGVAVSDEELNERVAPCAPTIWPPSSTLRAPPATRRVPN